MSIWSGVLAAVALVVIAMLAVFFVVGPERIWALAGPADLGPIDFETLKRRTSPNDSLSCPSRLCSARSDVDAPTFAVSAPELRRAFAKIVSTEPRVERVASSEGGFTERYIQRTNLMRFPDTVVVRFVDLGEGRSTLALYSRSQLGRSDFGANRARIERWLAKLAAEVPAVKTV